MAELKGGASKDAVRVGFIGIGNMGNPMAGHLVNAGWKVTVYDTDPAKVRSFTSTHGGSAAASLAELAREANLIITMLPDGHIVRRVAL
ncbi:MAG: 3-hydroxyisobutyrate dehydrogenase, partial [Betaproteobacteria bacterium]